MSIDVMRGKLMELIGNGLMYIARRPELRLHVKDDLNAVESNLMELQAANLYKTRFVTQTVNGVL